MQYLLMCCFDERLWTKIPEAQRDKIMQDYGKWVEESIRNGQHRSTAKLQSPSTARTIREKNGSPVITDGPFAETKEQIGGYHLIECKNLDEAVSIAKRIPTLSVGGTVEVRAVEALNG
jgi:hypothetical protein